MIIYVVQIEKTNPYQTGEICKTCVGDIIFFNWSIVDLQYYVSFRYTA